MASPFVAGYKGLVTPSVGSVPGVSVGPIGGELVPPVEPVSGTITIGLRSSTLWGYSDPASNGSISPDPFEYGGEQLTRCEWDSTPDWLTIEFGVGGLTQDFFAAVTLQDPDGGEITLLTADADTFSNSGALTRWRWESGFGSWSWTNDNGETADITISDTVPEEDDFMLALATSDVSRSNDTTETADPELVLAVENGNYYAVEGMLIFTSSSGTPDVALELGGPFTVNLDFGASGIVGIAQFTSLASLDEFKAESAGLDQTLPIPAGEFTIIRFWGFILANADGDLSVEWGQATSDAAATVRKAGSWFRVGKAT